MFAAGTGKRKFHNHIFGHRARRGVAVNISALTKAIDASAPAKDYPLFVPPKSTLPTASGTFAPTDSLPTSPMENFLVHTIAAIAIGLAITMAAIGLVVAGVTLKRGILKRRDRRHRQIRGGSSKGRRDPAEKKQEDTFDEKSLDSHTSLQNSPVSVKSPTLHLEHADCSPVQTTPRPSWFARVFWKSPTSRKNVEYPKETSPFLGVKSAKLPQQTTWSDFSSPEFLVHSMPLLHRVPEECKDVRERESTDQIAVTSWLSLHSLDSVTFSSPVHRAPQATSNGLRTLEASTVDGDQTDVQQVGAPSVSTESIVSPSGEEERSCSEMVDTGSKLVPRASLQTVGTGASGETGKRDTRDARASDEEYADVGQGY